MSLTSADPAATPAYSHAAAVAELVACESGPDGFPGDELVNEISACEQVVRAAQARQAELSARLVEERSAMMSGRQAYLSAAGESGLARGVSRSAAERTIDVGLCVRRMPLVLAGWADGLVSSQTVSAIVKALPALDDEEMALVESELVPLLPGLTSRTAGEIVRSLVIRIDPDAADHKAELARADRFVVVRDEADATATLIVQGPAEQVHAIESGLDRAASRLIADGDPRSRGQIMFDVLHEAALTGLDADGLPLACTVEIGLLMTADSLAGTDDTSAVLEGHGPVAPGVADRMINDADQVFFRRLITDPIDQTLVGIDTQRRLFTGPLGRFVRARDRNRCRAPWCESRARHTDHVQAHEHGGARRRATLSGSASTTTWSSTCRGGTPECSTTGASGGPRLPGAPTRAGSRPSAS